jgi:hypothetical protein
MATSDRDVQEEALRRALREAAELDMSAPPPVMGQTVHRIVRELTNVEDPYKEAKQRFNQFALDLYPELKKRVEKSANPVSAAIHLAAAGNIVDLGVKSGFANEQVHEAIENALDDPLAPEAVDAFCRAVGAADDVLYLGDNAGEIVFDRLLIEQLQRTGTADDSITYVVRGRPIINDATMTDAIETGMTELVPVIDNGSDGPGTILEDCSAGFRRRFDAADLIIAKGQGNYETLSQADKPIVHLLKVKCPVIAEDLGRPVGKLVLLTRDAAPTRAADAPPA